MDKKMTTKEQHRENCPARCKDNNTCHGKSFFLGKPGSAARAKECNSKCNYMKNRIEPLVNDIEKK